MHDAIGIIIGHNQAKAVCGGRSTVFPAVAAHAPTVRTGDGLAAGPTGIHINGSGPYLVGTDALQFATNRVIATLDRARYSDPAFVAMAQTALQAILDAPDPIRREPLLIMTGMPAAWFHDTNTQTQLRHALQEAARPWGTATVLIAPEAAGIFYAWACAQGRLWPERMRGATGVLDVGYRDANVALYRDHTYIDGRSIPGGMVQALTQIKILIDRTYQLELDLHEVDAAVRVGRVDVGGRQRPLPDGTAKALADVLDPILAVGRSLWPSGGRGLRNLLFGGGGAISQVARVREQFPHVIVPGADLTDDLPLDILQHRVQAAAPHLAGARGFAWIATLQQRQHAQQPPR